MSGRENLLMVIGHRKGGRFFQLHYVTRNWRDLDLLEACREDDFLNQNFHAETGFVSFRVEKFTNVEWCIKRFVLKNINSEMLKSSKSVKNFIARKLILSQNPKKNICMALNQTIFETFVIFFYTFRMSIWIFQKNYFLKVVQINNIHPIYLTDNI